MKNYARWMNEEEMKKILKPVNLKTGISKSGIPMMYDDEYLYIDDNISHTLVIGSSGSGKTQTVTMPIAKMAMMSGESIIVNDIHGCIYPRIASELEKRGYKTVFINFENTNLGNNWNPFTLPYKLYKENEKDKAVELIENIGYYLFTEPGENNVDPFWTNSVINLFTGLTLYLFEKGKEEEINLKSIYTITNNLDKFGSKLLSEIDKNSVIYFNISGTLNAPNETKGSIIAVFNQKINKYISREGLSNLMSETDFDITNISNEKTAIFIISGTSGYASNLIPLFVSQAFTGVEIFGKKEKELNILLDEFDTMLPIKDFASLINYSRGIKIKFVVTIKSYIDLINMYGKENTEIIKMCFNNIIYLLSNDIYTLEEISNFCGKQTDGNNIYPLITIEELKTMKMFEAIILIPRHMPFKTKLLPDYQIDWGFKEENKEISKKENHPIKIFDINTL